MESGTRVTSDGCSPRTSPAPTAGVSASPALTSASRGRRSVSGGREAAYFLELCALYKTSKKRIDPHTFSLRTLKTYLALMGERTSLSCSLRWTNAGTMLCQHFASQSRLRRRRLSSACQNGRLATLLITSRKTGSAYSLLDILEDEVESKYFLSKEQTEKIIFNK